MGRRLGWGVLAAALATAGCAHDQDVKMASQGYGGRQVVVHSVGKPIEVRDQTADEAMAEAQLEMAQEGDAVARAEDWASPDERTEVISDARDSYVSSGLVNEQGQPVAMGVPPSELEALETRSAYGGSGLIDEHGQEVVGLKKEKSQAPPGGVVVKPEPALTDSEIEAASNAAHAALEKASQGGVVATVEKASPGPASKSSAPKDSESGVGGSGDAGTTADDCGGKGSHKKGK